MNEMIERVARALFEEEWDDKSSDPWESAEEDEREAWRKSARAAIEAMREPTAAMEDAMEGVTEYGGHISPSNAWHAAIDAALK